MAEAAPLAAEDPEDRALREFREYARRKVADFMRDAGLTQPERDVAWLRVGHERTWAECAAALQADCGRQRPAVTASRAQRLLTKALGKLTVLVIARRLYQSPLHPRNAVGRAVGAPAR